MVSLENPLVNAYWLRTDQLTSNQGYQRTQNYWSCWGSPEATLLRIDPATVFVLVTSESFKASPAAEETSQWYQATFLRVGFPWALMHRTIGAELPRWLSKLSSQRNGDLLTFDQHLTWSISYSTLPHIIAFFWRRLAQGILGLGRKPPDRYPIEDHNL